LATTLLSWWSKAPHPRNNSLIFFVAVEVKRLVELGRNYPWQRPERCPRCGGTRVWGHGFVGAYFDEAGTECVLLKRYRCPECRVVIRLRPKGYFRRVQARIAAVRACLLHRIGTGRWPPGSNPARQRHWLRGLRRQVLAHLGMNYGERLAEGFEELVGRGICAVSRSV
jgi:hypothetical protein